jgi:hypothetical protein
VGAGEEGRARIGDSVCAELRGSTAACKLAASVNKHVYVHTHIKMRAPCELFLAHIKPPEAVPGG